MNLSECLSAAADLIEKNGWVQGAWTRQKSENGPISYCMIGAVRHLCPEKDLLSRHLAAGLGFRDIIEALNWNDVRGRTQVEVVARLRLGAIHAAAPETEGQIQWWGVP